MYPTALLAALICALTAGALAAMWPFMVAGLRENEKAGAIFWPLCGAVAIVVWAVPQVPKLPITAIGILIATLISGAFLVGTLGEWIRETVRLQRLDNTALEAAMLAGAGWMLACGRWLSEFTGWSLLLWIVSGALWQRLCDWIFVPEPIPPILRPDNPDLGVLQCHRDEWLARRDREHSTFLLR